MGDVPQPADKSKRYDRQIRIWGPHGQQRLETCKIALLNCGPTGSETLKNLVLGGVAAFTIVDGAKVEASDLGNNFLVDASSLGESRAKVVTELLQELNDAVAGSYVEETPETLIEANPGFFKQFSLIIATQISLAEHQVVESKPDNTVDDLRLNRPWVQLQEFVNSFDLSVVDDITHHHLPYAVVLIKAAEEWRAQHDRMPSNANERSAFKELINAMRRGLDGVPVEADNFDEALKAAFHVWTPYTIPSEVRAILEDEATNVTPSSDDFWIIIAALKTFVEGEGHGQLPLDGSIPDMHATTDLFLQLQRLYREQADRDVTAVEGYVRSTLQSLGRPSNAISRDTIKHYCKNARNLRLVRYRSLEEEMAADGRRSAALQQALSSETTQADASFYVHLRAVDRFHATHGRYPGSFDPQIEDDVPALKTCAGQILSELGINNSNIHDDYVVEMCRFGAAELHVIAAFMGGMAAQEAIKLITRQFVPVGATLIYNAITCTTSTFEL